jgi:hypothetical protein
MPCINTLSEDVTKKRKLMTSGEHADQCSTDGNSSAVINDFCIDTANHESLRGEVNRLRHELITEKVRFTKMKDFVMTTFNEFNELCRQEDFWEEILGMDIFAVEEQRNKALVEELEKERITMAMLKEEKTTLETELLRFKSLLSPSPNVE